MIQKIAIVGVGLIGGSLALQCRRKGIVEKIIGVENNPVHAQTAMNLHLVDEICKLADAVEQADVVVLTVPMNALVDLLPTILNSVTRQIVLDMGSTKSLLASVVDTHFNRGRFIATHPMWGTEYSGPSAAVEGAFENKAVILCDTEKSDPDVIEFAKSFYAQLKMHILEMNAVDHDLHAAYVSHISHITSFALANTVLEKEREDKTIFELASAGFESTVRLAKSNPEMWIPILMQNRKNVLEVLNEHISQLQKFKSCLENENWEYLNELIIQANQIRRIIQ